jgi:hypothetical protein
MRIHLFRASRLSARVVGAAVLCVAMSLGAASAVAQSSNLPDPAVGSDSVCPFAVMAVNRFHPPIQSDPQAGYPLWALKQNPDAQVQFDQKALVVRAQFPYAAWMAWSTYELVNAFPYSVLNQQNIVPDPGSLNPFKEGTRVYARNRHYTLMVLPDTYESVPGDPASPPVYSRLPADLQQIKNVLYRPANDTPIHSVTGETAGTDVTGAGANVTERVYAPFPGYDRVGNHGPTHTPMPKLFAVSLDNGTAANCAPNNLIPPKAQHNPAQPVDPGPPPPGLFGTDGFGPGAGPQGSHSQYGPKPNPRLVQFFRPGLFDAPAADVPSVPPPDKCAGYLTAQLNDRQIALVRLPHVPTFIDVNTLTPASVFTQKEVGYVSYNIYGSEFGNYRPGDPTTMGVNDALMLQDTTGGMTLVVWPRVGPYSGRAARRLIWSIAGNNGWAVVQGNVNGRVYGDKLFVRQKGTAPEYRGGYTPNDFRPGVPCFRDSAKINAGKGLPIVPPDAPYSSVPAAYAAKPSETGSGTPQGVECTLSQYTTGVCLARLKQYIKSTGGSYFARS